MNAESDKLADCQSGISHIGALLVVTTFVAACILGLAVWKHQAMRSHLASPVDRLDVGQPLVFQDPYHRFNCAIPDGWLVEASIAQGPSAMTLVTFHSPENVGLNTLAVWNHTPAPGYSARRWAEQEVEAGARIGKKDGTVRPTSWIDLQVGGRPAASLITDLAVDSGMYTIYHVYVMTDTSSLKFRFMIPSGGFAKVRPVVDALLGGFEFN